LTQGIYCDPGPFDADPRAFGDGLFELRPRGRSGIGRTFYCFLVGRRVIVLHAFIKKSQQTPDREVKIARKRLKEIQNG
jgi:phage-related protein